MVIWLLVGIGLFVGKYNLLLLVVLENVVLDDSGDLCKVGLFFD